MIDNKPYFNKHRKNIMSVVRHFERLLPTMEKAFDDSLHDETIRGWHRGEMKSLYGFYKKVVRNGLESWKERLERLNKEEAYYDKVVSLCKKYKVKKAILDSVKDIIVLEDVRINTDGSMDYVYFGMEMTLKQEFVGDFYRCTLTDENVVTHTGRDGKTNILMPRHYAANYGLFNPNLFVIVNGQENATNIFRNLRKTKRIERRVNPQKQ